MKHLHQLQKDKKLAAVIKRQNLVVLREERNTCIFLCYSIISQQLSTKAAAKIKERFLGLFGKTKPSASKILSIPFDKLKAIGLSSSKTTYIINVCRFFTENKLTDNKLKKMSDEEIIACLTEIKGVGNWTAEMVLMFAMQREDVFSADDLGIQQQMIKLYGIKSSDKKELKIQMLKIAESWKPYRTYACRYLWGWKDTSLNVNKK
jgi:DNA-3-methyladenine glycosylase II